MVVEINSNTLIITININKKNVPLKTNIITNSLDFYHGFLFKLSLQKTHLRYKKTFRHTEIKMMEKDIQIKH